jgi:hypothetical protein
MVGGSGNATLTASGGTGVTIFGGSGNDSLGSANADSVLMVGGGGNSTLAASGGTGVTIFGGSGNDSLSSSNGNGVSMVGGSGNATLTASGGTGVTIFGGNGSDSLASSNVASLLMTGGAGRDTLTSANDSDAVLLSGGLSNDLLAVTDGTRVAVMGGGGDDTLSAAGGTGISLSGLDGDNLYQLTGTPADPLDVALDDLGTFGVALPQIDGFSDGVNTLAFSGVTSGITLDLSNASLGTVPGPSQEQQVAPGLTLSLTGYFQNVIGTPGANWIKGDPASNVLQGQGGNDTLIAGSGPATLVAGSGSDVLMGGLGGTTYSFARTNLGSVTVVPASNTSNDTLDFSQLGGGVTLDMTSSSAQPVSPAAGLTLTVTNPLGITGVVGSAFDNAITGNARDDVFTVGGGNDTITGGGGNDTYVFNADSHGTKVLDETPATHNTLNFHAFDGPVNVNLTQTGPQVVSPGSLALTLSPPTAFDGLIGSRFADTLVGNDRGDALIGGGDDSITAGSGADYVQAGITQVVYLDFDAGSEPGYHVYTPDERDAIQSQLESIYKDFSYVFTQDPTQASQLSRLTGGQYATLEFNVGVYPGASHNLDTDHIDLGGLATVNINPALGSSPDLVPDTSANVIGLTATIAAHELGHFSGLVHADSFGPIGTGIYSGVSADDFYPAYTGAFDAVDTPYDVMASPDSVNSPLIDAAGPTQLGERDALHLAFDDSGTLLRSQDLTGLAQPVSIIPGVTSAIVLGALPPLAVPNTLIVPGTTGYGKTFQAVALGVEGTIATPGQEDFYAITGRAGEVMSFEVASQYNTLNPAPFQPELEVLDASGKQLAYTVQNFEHVDPMILDLRLPADGAYYVGVDAYYRQATGDYKLLMYSLTAVTGGTPQGNGATVTSSGGNDTLIGSSANDTFTYAAGATGQVTIDTGSGADVLDLRQAPQLTYTRTGDTTLGSLTILTQVATAVSLTSDQPAGSTYGQTITFTATVSADTTTFVTPTGSVQFQIDGSAFGDPLALADGTASLTTAILSAGPHLVTAVYTSDNSSFSGSRTASALNQAVAPAPLTVTANDATKIYGSPNPGFTANYSGFVLNEDADVLGGSLTFTTSATTASHVGSYDVTPGGLNSTNYNITFVPGKLTVTPAALLITADSKTNVYGDPLPALTASYAGFVNGDTAANLATPPTLSTTATATSHVGSYAITASGATDPDYTISYVPGILTVTPAALTITADDKTMTYGGTLPALTASYAGLVNGDTPSSLATPPTLATAPATSHVGSYAITAAGAVDADYDISYLPGTLTITPATLTVTADDRSMVYGGNLPGLTFSYSGFVNGEDSGVVGGSPSLTTTATAASGVGTYTIAIEQGSLTAANYAFTFVNGVLSVTPAVLTVTADDASRAYGANNPTFTDTITGFVNGDGPASVSGFPSLTTAATSASVVGTYPITAAQGSLSAANYSFVYASGTLTIFKATPALALADAGGFYNGLPFPATVTVAGVLTGVDTIPSSSLEGISPTLTYYAGGSASGTPLPGAPAGAGTYTVVASFAGSADYAAASASTTFTIAAATPILSVSNLGGTFNGQAFPATATVAGVVSGVDATPGPTLEGVGLTLTYYAGSTATGTPLSGAPAAAGIYTVVASFAGSADYTADSASTNFTITAANPTVAVTDAGGTYNGRSYPATATVAGVSNVAAASLEGVGLTLTYYAGGTAGGTPLPGAPAAAGTYTVLATYAGSADYAAAAASATFVITAAAPVISIADAGGTYNGQPFPATATVAGVVAGVDATPGPTLEGVGLTLTYYAGSTATGTPLSGAPAAAGIYTVVASFAGSADYAAASVNATFSVNVATPTVTVTDGGGTYTGQPFPATATVAGVVPGVDTTPAPILEGVSPTLTYYAGTNDSGTPLSGAPSAVGTYTVDAVFAGSADYGPATASTTFVISSSGTKATPTVVVADAGGTYNGQPFPATATVAGTNGQPGSSLEGVGLTLTYYAGAHARGTPLTGAPSAAGTYTVLASFPGSANYKAVIVSKTFTITKATPTVVVVDSGGTYSGHPSPAAVTVAGVNGTPTASLENVTPSLTYYALGSGGPTKLSGAPKAAGSYSVVASFAGSADYGPATKSVTFSIGQATPVVGVVAAGGTYNGKPFPATATVTGVSGSPAASLEGVKPTLTYYALGSGGGKTPLAGAPTAVGSYEVDASFAGSADYTAAASMATFVISPATPKVVVSDKGGTFNGQPFVAKATITGVGGAAGASLEGVGLTLAYYAGSTALPGAPATAGLYTVVASFAGSADYAAASVSTTFTIARATPKVVVSDKGGTYNGQPFPATATVAGVVSGVDNTPAASLEGVSPSLTYYLVNADGTTTPLSGAPSGAGRYEVDAAFAGSTDYAAVVRMASFTIKQALPKVMISATGGTYSGQPFVATATVTGLGGTPGASLEGVSPTLAYYLLNADGTKTLLAGAPSAAGRYEVDAAFAGSADYAAVTRSATFTIKKATPTFSLLASPTINEGTATTLLSGKISLGSLTPTGQVTITVGGVSMSAAVQSDGTFSVAFATGSLGIGKHSITYSYSGDDDFNPITGKGTLTVLS